MKNKKTTIMGYISLGAAALIIIVTVAQGGDLDGALKIAVPLAIPGAGLIAASDGGH